MNDAPLGATIPWDKSLPGTPPLPPNWVERNGGYLDNPTSPYHGLYLKDLNNTRRFVRGGLESGIEEDSALMGHGHEGASSASNPNLKVKDGYVMSGDKVGLRAATLGEELRVKTIIPDGVHGTPVVDDENRPINTSMVWITKVSNSLKHESRLLNPEDEDIHVNIEPKPGATGGNVGVTKAPVSTGAGVSGMTEGIALDGKIPITCVRVGATGMNESTRSVNENDGVEVVLSYALMTKRLGKPFVFSSCTFYLYNRNTQEWYAPDSVKAATASKLLGGAAASDQLSAVLTIKSAEAGEYLVIGAVQP